MVDEHEASNSKAARMQLLVESGPGTPMGRLLRKFWQPVAVLSEIPVGSARQLRILGEDLTLYRGASGNAYLVGGVCAHRCTVLHMGWVEGEEIRCMYHGWRYDGTGKCTELPAEPKMDPSQIRIPGYPVHDYCGLLFAYMGDGPAPEFELPRKEELENADRVVFCGPLDVWDCNWFQLVENSLDATHVSYVHAWGRIERFSAEVTTKVPELRYLETEAGMRQIATRGEGNVRITDWTFPNNNHIVVPARGKNDPWVDVVAWFVPIDDEHVARFLLGSFPKSDEVTAKRVIDEYTFPYFPAQHYDEVFVKHELPGVTGLRFTSLQDYVSTRGQGRIADRVNERLGASDAGVAMLRKIFFRELDAVNSGHPGKGWSRLEHGVEMTTPVPAGSAT